RELVLRPDTPLENDVKDMIAAQLAAAQERFTAIGHGRDGDSGTSPGTWRPAWLLRAASLRTPATAGCPLKMSTRWPPQPPGAGSCHPGVVASRVSDPGKRATTSRRSRVPPMPRGQRLGTDFCMPV